MFRISCNSRSYGERNDWGSTGPALRYCYSCKIKSAGLEVWEAFRANNLPAVVFTDVSLFSSPEAKEILGTEGWWSVEMKDRSGEPLPPVYGHEFN